MRSADQRRDDGRMVATGRSRISNGQYRLSDVWSLDVFEQEGCRSRDRNGGGVKMNVQATKLQAVENDLKQLMADVTRAMEKAQEAVARMPPTP